MATGNSRFFKKIMKRKNAARDRLLKYREAIGSDEGPDAGKLDYEASFSVPGQELRLYNFMKQKAAGNQALDQALQDNPETPESTRKNGRAQEMLDSPLDAMKEGASIRRSFLQPKLRYLFLKSAGWNKEANKLLSGEGKRYRAAHGGMPEKKAAPAKKPLITNEEPRIKNGLRKSGSLDDDLILSAGPKKSREEIASEDADKLFRIGAGVLSDAKETAILKEKFMDSVLPGLLEEEKQKGDKGHSLRAKRRAEKLYRENGPKHEDVTSAEDREWYEHITNNASLELLRELNLRRKQAAFDLDDYRQDQGREHPDEDAHKLDFESAYSPKGRDLGLYDYILTDMTNSPAMEEYQEKYPDYLEPEADQIKAEKAFSLLGNGSGGKYAVTEEGKQRSKLMIAQEIKAQKDTYAGKIPLEDPLDKSMILDSDEKKKKLGLLE